MANQQQQGLDFLLDLQKMRDAHVAQKRREKQEELRAARARRDSLVDQLRDEEAHCRWLERELKISHPALAKLEGDILVVLIQLLQPKCALALCLSSKRLHKKLYAGLMRGLRIRYQLADNVRLMRRELLVEATWVTFELKPLRPPAQLKPLPQPARESYCLRCRLPGHELTQCATPCRYCRQCGHAESRCRARLTK